MRCAKLALCTLGELRVNARNFQSAYVTVPDGSLPCDVFIDGVWDRNRALDGDTVLVHLLPTSAWKTKGDIACACPELSTLDDAMANLDLDLSEEEQDADLLGVAISAAAAEQVRV